MMVDRMYCNKGVSLGYEEKVGKLIGRRWGYDIYCKKSGRDMTVNVYDRKKCRGSIYDEPEFRVAAYLGLSKVNGAWHVDLVEVDSRYKGKKLANKLYRFLMKTLGITMMAGTAQSAGGRYIWNTLAKDKDITVYAKKGLYSTVIDFPKAGKRELKSNLFDLYAPKTAIFAVAG
tara:strand:- start:53 stop:574 length:522 start_codon:yes stop_codon:yes gene_type:complete